MHPSSRFAEFTAASLLWIISRPTHSHAARLQQLTYHVEQRGCPGWRPSSIYNELDASCRDLLSNARYFNALSRAAGLFEILMNPADGTFPNTTGRKGPRSLRTFRDAVPESFNSSPWERFEWNRRYRAPRKRISRGTLVAAEKFALPGRVSAFERGQT